MMRLLLCLIALAFPIGSVAQEVEQPINIIGKVWYSESPYPADELGEKFEQPIIFAAWRQTDGPVSTTILAITVEADTLAEVQAIVAQFPRDTPARFTVSDPITYYGETGLAQSAGGRLARIIEPVADAEITNAAEPIINPKSIEEPELGRFEPSTVLFGFFGQKREWFGNEIPFEVALVPMGPIARERAFFMARMAWKDRTAIDAEIREAVANHIYLRLGKEARVRTDSASKNEGEPVKLSREEFKADHTLKNVTCWAQDHCEFVYQVRRAEWVWNYRGYVDHKGESWYLEGWNFP